MDKMVLAVQDVISGIGQNEAAKKHGVDAGLLSKVMRGVKISQQLTYTVDHKVNEVNCVDCDKVKALQAELAEAEETVKISNDCQNCAEKKELVKALLQINDLRQEIESLKAFPTESPVIEKIVEVEKDCGQCEKLAEQEQARAELQAEIDRLLGHKENLMSKCDRLAQELEQARAQEKEKDCGQCERLAQEKKNIEYLNSSLDAERQQRERLESALNQIENKKNSLRSEIERLQSERDGMTDALSKLKTENNDLKNTVEKITTERDALYGVPLWVILLAVVFAAAAFFAGRWI